MNNQPVALIFYSSHNNAFWRKRFEKYVYMSDPKLYIILNIRHHTPIGTEGGVKLGGVNLRLFDYAPALVDCF
ncbi:hypothetical protein Q75_15735 [Bacillus coahuilensis p1.1.43]|uniref:Uncharacterized protein n=1 Tax=Bacillus coahuilensis p1.1.43 TaxID=1150625 RepID=A0A147K4Q7_9BACI|nr:hypothetical protein Q75_15735 [Bacillus coahuilensis p1.1.43]